MRFGGGGGETTYGEAITASLYDANNKNPHQRQSQFLVFDAEKAGKLENKNGAPGGWLAKGVCEVWLFFS